MRRRTLYFTLVAVICVLTSGLIAWRIALPDMVFLVTPGAENLRIQRLGSGVRVVTYHVPSSDTEWLSVLDQRLRAQGWMPPDYSGASQQFTIYTYVNSLQFGSMWQEINLEGTAHYAHIVMRRWLRLPWLSAQPIYF